MSQLPPAEPNPYQSPAVISPVAQPALESQGHYHKILKDFRSQIVALGAFWIFIGAVAAGLGIIAGGVLSAAREVNPESTIVLVILLVSGCIWIGLGVLVCLKQMWAVYVALVLSYLSVVSSLFRLQICAVLLLVFVILQAHRVLGWAKQLRAAGIPLTTRPEDLQVNVV